jgi:hypothetical protein
MAKKEASKFVMPDGTARAAEADKTARLRALRLAKEAQAAKEQKDAADIEAAAKHAKAQLRRRVRTPQPPDSPALT